MLLIFGKGKVGNAVAQLCDSRGIAYEIRDDSDGLTSFDTYETIIPSPGVPSYHAVYATGKVMSELDFACQYLPTGFTTIAVTGTDGKSTTSSILYSILEKEYFGKKSVYLSGNFDIPFSETVRQILEKGEKKGIIVIEVSSFMAYSLKKFAPDYSIFTNFKADHLNWHRDLQNYLDSKMHIIARAKKGSIMNIQVIDFAKTHGLHIEIPENVRIFSLGKVEDVYGKIYKNWTDGEGIIISGRKKYRISETQFSGSHNAMNILASTMVTNIMKICSKRVKTSLKSISGLPHRLENIGEKNGVIFIEDSKSTSSQSLEAALGSFGRGKNLLLIVGGSDKGDSFAYLSSKFRDRVKAMGCIGVTKDYFTAIAKKEHIPFIATDILTDAVEFLWNNAEKGDVLMLSPGCASFGLFRDYFDRANQFREIIKKLSE